MRAGPTAAAQATTEHHRPRSPDVDSPAAASTMGPYSAPMPAEPASSDLDARLRAGDADLDAYPREFPTLYSGPDLTVLKVY